MARPKRINKAPGIGKEELGKLLDISLSCSSTIRDAQEHQKNLYQLILSMDSTGDTDKVKELCSKLRYEGQFMGLMLEGALSSVQYVIDRNRYLAAYAEHKQLLWEEQLKEQRLNQVKSGGGKQ